MEFAQLHGFYFSSQEIFPHLCSFPSELGNIEWHMIYWLQAKLTILSK